MSIIKLVSDNPKFSHIIAKNPNTIREAKQPFMRELRAGKVYGWFEDYDAEAPKVFKLMFVDSDINNSFAKNTEFEYLDMTRYSDAYLVIMMLSTALNSATKTPHEDDVGKFQCEIQFVAKAPRNLVTRFENLLPEFTATAISQDHFNISYSSSSVLETLNMAMLFCAVVAVSNDDNPIPLPEAGIVKYLGVLNKAKAPYYLRHLFVSRAINNKDLFNKLVGSINTDTFFFTYGNTQLQRLNAIKLALAPVDRADNLIDIGCGELSQSPKLLGSHYSSIVGFDADKEIVETCERKIKHKKLEGILVHHQEVTRQWIEENDSVFEGSDILMSEIIEHMDKDSAQDLVLAAMRVIDKNLVITVPNGDFNKYYGIASDDVRHSDHKWEPTFDEFVDFICNTIKASGVNLVVNFKMVGDTVVEGDKSISVTTMAHITKE